MSKKEAKARSPVLIGLQVVLVSSLVLFLIATLTEMYLSPPSPQSVPTPTSKSAKDNLIVPGTRVGPVTLGLPLEEVESLFGKGQKRPSPNGVYHLYEKVGLIVYTENKRVASVSVRSPNFLTRQGIRVGSDVDDVLTHLGRDYELEGNDDKYVLHNWSQGWHVGVEDSTVTYFQVTAPLSGNS